MDQGIDQGIEVELRKEAGNGKEGQQESVKQPKDRNQTTQKMEAFKRWEEVNEKIENHQIWIRKRTKGEKYQYKPGDRPKYTEVFKIHPKKKRLRKNLHG